MPTSAACNRSGRKQSQRHAPPKEPQLRRNERRAHIEPETAGDQVKHQRQKSHHRRGNASIHCICDRTAKQRIVLDKHHVAFEFGTHEHISTAHMSGPTSKMNSKAIRLSCRKNSALGHTNQHHRESFPQFVTMQCNNHRWGARLEPAIDVDQCCRPRGPTTPTHMDAPKQRGIANWNQCGPQTRSEHRTSGRAVSEYRGPRASTELRVTPKGPGICGK